MLEAVSVSKIFKNGSRMTTAVRNVSLCLKKGEFLAIVGESGSGKTTLARMLAGIMAPGSGQILLDGKSIAPPARRRDKKICSAIQMVLQDGKSALDPRYTVYKSIAEPLRNLTDLKEDRIRETVFSLMERLELEPSLSDRHANELSGGQQKRVCIARALAPGPEYLFYDEAVSGLDVLVKTSVLKLIKDLHREREDCSVLITHDLDAALYLADRIVVMKEGVIVEDRLYSGNPACFTNPYTKVLLRKMDPYEQEPGN